MVFQSPSATAALVMDGEGGPAKECYDGTWHLGGWQGGSRRAGLVEPYLACMYLVGSIIGGDYAGNPLPLHRLGLT